VTRDVRERGLEVIRSSVEAIGTFYQFSKGRDPEP